MRDIIIGTVIGSVFITAGAFIVEELTDGGLIGLLGGATKQELNAVDARFEMLKLMSVRGDYGRGGSSRQPDPCPSGWTDTGLIMPNTYPGGDCGRGSLDRICIRAEP